MDIKELAAKLNGREYRNEIDRATQRAAKMHGIVIVFGASDDLMEFRGAIYDECSCYHGGEVFADERGLLPHFEEVRDDGSKLALRDYFQREPHARSIKAVWGEDGYSWSYETDIPHETFDVLDEGEPYCKGIVFRLADASLSVESRHVEA